VPLRGDLAAFGFKLVALVANVGLVAAQREH